MSRLYNRLGTAARIVPIILCALHGLAEACTFGLQMARAITLSESADRCLTFAQNHDM